MRKEISCISKKLLWSVIVKLAVIFLLSVNPFIGTILDPFGGCKN